MNRITRKRKSTDLHVRQINRLPTLRMGSNIFGIWGKRWIWGKMKLFEIWYLEIERFVIIISYNTANASSDWLISYEKEIDGS